MEEIPDRLEINSYFLWEDLLDATGIDLGETRVLLRPFKVLVLYEQEIRHVLESREQTHKGLVAEATAKFDKETALTIKVAKRRVDYLQLTVKFIDTDLADIQTLRRQISDGTLQKISFDNLWHLFNPGELIVNRGHYQAYRVLHVAGGRPLFSSGRPLDGGDDDDREPASEMHRDWTRSDFDIDCFSMFFDGEEIVPVPQQITIPEYGGERAITSLAVFPLKFLKDKVSVRKALLERGRRFKKVAGVQHKRYTGPTMGTAPEEVIPALFSG